MHTVAKSESALLCDTFIKNTWLYFQAVSYMDMMQHQDVSLHSIFQMNACYLFNPDTRSLMRTWWQFDYKGHIALTLLTRTFLLLLHILSSNSYSSHIYSQTSPFISLLFYAFC